MHSVTLLGLAVETRMTDTCVCILQEKLSMYMKLARIHNLVPSIILVVVGAWVSQTPALQIVHGATAESSLSRNDTVLYCNDCQTKACCIISVVPLFAIAVLLSFSASHP